MSDYNELHNEVIANLIFLRTSKGYSLEEVGNVLGITKQGYRKIEKGDTQIPLQHLFKMAAFYEVDLVELIVKNLSHQMAD